MLVSVKTISEVSHISLCLFGPSFPRKTESKQFPQRVVVVFGVLVAEVAAADPSGAFYKTKSSQKTTVLYLEGLASYLQVM